MTCYDGFGNLAAGRHRFWVDGFGATGGKQILFYYQGDNNWWLGSIASGQLTWEFVGKSQIGNVNDGRPVWTGYFSNLTRAEVLVYWPPDHLWYLGTFSGNQLTWRSVGTFDGEHPIWVDDFNGDGRTEVLFYGQRDHNWWMGSISGGSLTWRLVGNTAGFGNLNDGRPIWSGYFRGVFQADLLFYHPGDHNWWMGVFNGSTFNWQFVGNTSGFGNLNDGRPLWTGNFQRGFGGTDILFYQPGDNNWWFGSIVADSLTWRPAGRATGFGRPFWTADFTGDGQLDVLNFQPSDHTWRLGSISGGQLAWNSVGNTSGFGQVWDGRPFWVGDFNRDGKAEMLFYFSGDGNWWLGSYNGSQLTWSNVGNTGRPLTYRSMVNLHIKIVATTPQSWIDSQIAEIKGVFDTARIGVTIRSREDLTGDSSLNSLKNPMVQGCIDWGAFRTTPDQDRLFQNRNFVGQDEVVIYIVQSLISDLPPEKGIVEGCATHPNGRPGFIVSRSANHWVMAHELGHVLGLSHVTNTDRLMHPYNNEYTNTPPDLDQGEANWMDGSSLTKTC